jgi:broad specificity phosphatase PhoE
MPKSIEFRRHAKRARDEDALSPEGRAQAEDIGRTLSTTYVHIFVSPARRAAETVAWFLRGSGQALPPHAVVEGLASPVEDRWRAAGKAATGPDLGSIRAVDQDLVAEESARLAAVARELFDRIPDGATALAVGHSPLIEALVYGLTGSVIEPLGECDGVTVVESQDGHFRVIGGLEVDREDDEEDPEG